MSTDQQSKPRPANQSMAEESGRPGTCRSNVGCAAIEEPCTNKIVPMLLPGSPAHFSHRNSFTPPSLVVQCSSPLTATLAISFIVHLLRSDLAFFGGRSYPKTSAARPCEKRNPVIVLGNLS